MPSETETPPQMAVTVEQCAKALAMARFKDHKPPVRWPSDECDKLSGRDGTVALTWDYAEQCREQARIVLDAARLSQQSAATGGEDWPNDNVSAECYLRYVTRAGDWPAYIRREAISAMVGWAENHAAPKPAHPNDMAPTVEEHGDWLVWYQPWPIESREFDWHFARKGIRSDDGISTGNEESREMCLQTIDFLNDEDAKDAEREASGENTKFVDSAMRILNRALLYQALKQVMQLPGIRNLPGFATGTHLQSADYALAQYEEQTHD